MANDFKESRVHFKQSDGKRKEYIYTENAETIDGKLVNNKYNTIFSEEIGGEEDLDRLSEQEFIERRFVVLQVYANENDLSAST